MKTTRCRWRNVVKTILLLSARAEVCRQDPSASGNADGMFISTAKQQFIISPAWSLMKLNPTQLFSCSSYKHPPINVPFQVQFLYRARKNKKLCLKFCSEEGSPFLLKINMAQAQIRTLNQPKNKDFFFLHLASVCFLHIWSIH